MNSSENSRTLNSLGRLLKKGRKKAERLKGGKKTGGTPMEYTPVAIIIKMIKLA